MDPGEDPSRSTRRHALWTWRTNSTRFRSNRTRFERLGEVKAPTLIVVGDLDTPETLEIADVLERGIAGAKKWVIPGTAHHPHMEKPEEFNRIVMEFLSGLCFPPGWE